MWLARVKRTQGRKGEVFAEILTDFPEKFAERKRLWLVPKTLSAGASTYSVEAHGAAHELELRHHWLHKGGIVLHFAGVDSISAAEELLGCIVAVPRAERARLEEGDVYISDLIGCVLVDVAGAAPAIVGKIEDVDRSAGPVAMLVVKPESRLAGEPTNQRSSDDEILIPFAKDYLRSIDVDTKRVVMALPEGLIELNES